MTPRARWGRRRGRVGEGGSTGTVAETCLIVGPARSGTSFVYRALCLHREVAFISNWYARFGRAPLATLTWVTRWVPELSRRIWFGAEGDAYRYGRPRPWWERAFPAPVEGEPVYTRAGVGRPGGPPPAAVAPEVALRAAFDTLRRLGGGSCVVSKRIANNLRIPLLARIFPEARFVFVVRDGRAVAASLSRVDWWEDSFVWWYGGTPRRWRDEGRDPWEMCARNWVEELHAIEEGLRAVPSGQVLHLRYEDLLADPVAGFERVASFLGLPPDPRWRGSVERLALRDRAERWRERLDPAVLERITAIQRDELERYGYTC